MKIQQRNNIHIYNQPSGFHEKQSSHLQNICGSRRGVSKWIPSL
jgi:hypothetical protein